MVGETQADADIAEVLTMDNARRIAANIAKLPLYLIANADPMDERSSGGIVAAHRRDSGSAMRSEISH